MSFLAEMGRQNGAGRGRGKLRFPPSPFRFAVSLFEITLSLLEYFIMQPGLFGAGGIWCADAGSICPPVFQHVVFQCIFFSRWNAVHQRPVIFSEAFILQLPVQLFRSKGGLGEYEDSFHRLVQAVDYGKIRLSVLRFLRKNMCFEYTYHIRSRCIFGLDSGSMRFYTYDYIFIFIQYI